MKKVYIISFLRLSLIPRSQPDNQNLVGDFKIKKLFNSIFFNKSTRATIKLSLSRLKLGTKVYVINATNKKEYN